MRLIFLAAAPPSEVLFIEKPCFNMDDSESDCLDDPHMKEFPCWIKLSSNSVVLILTFDRARKELATC